MRMRLITAAALVGLLIGALTVNATSAAPHYQPPPPNSPQLTTTPAPTAEGLPGKPTPSAPHPDAPGRDSTTDTAPAAVTTAENTYSTVYLGSGWTYQYCYSSSINPYSYVFASVTELGSDGLPHDGAAHFVVGNIVPKQGYAEVYVFSDWGETLPAWLNCTVTG